MRGGKKGFSKLEAEVFATNARALHLFQKFGFSTEAVRAREYLVEGAFVDQVCLYRFDGARPEEGAAVLR